MVTVPDTVAVNVRPDTGDQLGRAVGEAAMLHVPAVYVPVKGRVTGCAALPNVPVALTESPAVLDSVSDMPPTDMPGSGAYVPVFERVMEPLPPLRLPEEPVLTAKVPFHVLPKGTLWRLTVPPALTAEPDQPAVMSTSAYGDELGTVPGPMWIAMSWGEPLVNERVRSYGVEDPAAPKGRDTPAAVNTPDVIVPSVPPPAVAEEIEKQRSSVVPSGTGESFHPDGKPRFPPVMHSSVPPVVSAMYPERPVPPTLPPRKLKCTADREMVVSRVQEPLRPAAVPARVDAPPKLPGVKESDAPAEPMAVQSVWNGALHAPPGVNAAVPLVGTAKLGLGVTVAVNVSVAVGAGSEQVAAAAPFASGMSVTALQLLGFVGDPEKTTVPAGGAGEPALVLVTVAVMRMCPAIDGSGPTVTPSEVDAGVMVMDAGSAVLPS